MIISSVLIPAYNLEEYIREVIKSELTQKYQNFKSTTVRGCLTNNILEITKKIAYEVYFK